MNKNVKFRGWNIEKGDWVYGYFYMFGDDSFIIEKGQVGIPEQHIRVVGSSVGQFIGVCDIFNKQIFSGDILKDGKLLALVEWDNGGARFYSVVATQKSWANCEVVGTLYENAELLVTK